MIKATRIWGGNSRQGLAFGLLDGGRGAVSWLFGFIGIGLFTLFMTENIDLSSWSDQRQSFALVIQITSLIILGTAVLLFIFYKTNPKEDTVTPVEKTSLRQILSDYLQVLRIPSVYLLMIIIVCAYSGYKITDIYSQYANEVMGYNPVEAAEIGRDLLGIRIFISVVIGLLADLSRSSLMMIAGFILTVFGAGLMASGWIGPSTSLLFWISIIITATGVYAFRTLYFSAIQEAKIPLAVTGTAVGLISLVGYTPDIFMGPVIGLLLDSATGSLGFQRVFLLLGGFAILGLVASIFLHRHSSKVKA